MAYELYYFTLDVNNKATKFSNIKYAELYFKRNKKKINVTKIKKLSFHHLILETIYIVLDA